jgi:hypothetical protein
VLRLMLKVGKDYGLKAVRLPNEPPLKSWKAAGASLASRLISWIFLSPWMILMKQMLRRHHVRHNDFLLGMSDSGAMTLDLVLRFVRNLPEGVTEICFHPATCRCSEIDGTMPLYHHEEEFKALTSDALRAALRDAGTQTISFSDL